MVTLEKLSVRQKLIAITMITVFGVTLFLASMVVLNEVVEGRRSVYEKRTEQLAIVAEIIASRSTAAVVFDDVTTATENLGSLGALRSDTALVSAAIFAPDDAPFAEYRQTDRPHGSPRTRADARGCDDGDDEVGADRMLRVCAPIALHDDRIGEVRLVYDMGEDLESFQDSLRGFLIGVLVVVAAALGLALVLSAWLQRIISGPILHLREAMRKVSSSKDYAVRVEPAGDDELGALVDGFNEMLGQIQRRDTELALNRDQLQDQIEARTRELEKANRQRMLWLENLARILRHELKTATVGLRSSLELIERRAGDERLGKYIERARTSTNYMANLLDSVGTASTLESSFDQDRKRRLELAPLMARQVDACAVLYPDVRIVHRCQPGLEVVASEARLVQLLDKLIANAVDHNAAGSSIVVAAEGRERSVIISVSNRGAPLPDDRERMFELFVSLRDAEHKSSENFGLGLYIVKLIVESHGGQVAAEDLPGRSGARINVTLPRADSAR